MRRRPDTPRPRSRRSPARAAPCWPGSGGSPAFPGTQRPHKRGVPPPKDAAPGLAVAAPELDVIAAPRVRAPPESPQGNPKRGIEPDDPVGGLEHEVAELPLVIAIDYPAVWRFGHELADARLQLFPAGLGPVRTVVDRVELEIGNAQALGE